MVRIVLSILLASSVLIVANNALSNANAGQKALFKSLADNNYPDLIPLIDNKPIEVTVSQEYKQFLGYDEKLNIIKFTGYFVLQWTDPQMVWNPNAYNNITSIMIPEKVSWTPDITPYNVDSDSEVFRDTSVSKKIVSNTGSTLYSRKFVFSVACNPSNENESEIVCPTKIGSWNFDDSKIILKVENNNAIIEMEAGSYALKNVTFSVTVAVYVCCPEKFPAVQYYYYVIKKETPIQISPLNTFIMLPLTLALLSIPFIYAIPLHHTNRVVITGIHFLIMFHIGVIAARPEPITKLDTCFKIALVLNFILFIWSCIIIMMWTYFNQNCMKDKGEKLEEKCINQENAEVTTRPKFVIAFYIIDGALCFITFIVILITIVYLWA